ncbi:MAG: AMP-binding protein [Pseudomonadota bacterium]|nr:AMP-binding protein [Pseudomonadota bacterium]
MPDRIEPVWIPDPDAIARTRLHRLMLAMGCEDYESFRLACLHDPERHWREALRRIGLRFETDFDQLVDLSGGKAWPRWFPGGRFNCVAPVLARAEAADNSDDIALISETEEGEVRRFTRRAFVYGIRCMAAALKAEGIGKGDRVAMLLPNMAEAAMLPLACAYLGAVIVPLYSGFGAKPIADRVNHSGAKVLITCVAVRRNGRDIALMETVVEAAKECPGLTRILSLTREEDNASIPADPEAVWDPFAKGPIAEPPCLTEPDDPVMLIYTSGTSGRPKGTVHTHGGFPLRIAYDLAFLFDLHAGERFFWFSDMGWMIGPMAVFGPQLLGACTVLYDGGPSVPNARRLFDLAERHEVTHFGAAPTLTRAWLAADAAPAKGIVDTVRVLLTAGEAVGPAAFDYLFRKVGAGSRPVINYTGGTEVSGGLLTNVLVRPIAPCLFNAVAPGVSLSLRDADGRRLPADSVEAGELAIENVFPGMTKGLWRDPATYLATYWDRFPDTWAHGDLVRRLGDYWDLIGRADDVMKIAGRRIGPSEVEACVSEVDGVVLAAAVGLPDEKSGEALHVFVVGSGPNLSDRIGGHIIRRLGKAFRPAGIHLIDDLPRTRNNKIMRRVLRQAALGDEPGDLSALANPECLQALAPLKSAF